VQKYIVSIVIICLVCIAYFFSNDQSRTTSPVSVSPAPGNVLELPEINPERSSIGTKENPRARKAYEEAMLVDPATGKVPFDIKIREARFSSTIPKRLVSRHGLRNGATAEEEWRSIGPYNKGGRTRALAIDVSDEKVILAGGVSGGMWRSADDGKHWQKTTVPANIHSVSCIGQDMRPGKEQTWYYGTGEFTSNSASKKDAPYRGDGVFKSIDGGLSWNKLLSTSEGVPNNFNSQFQYIWKVLPNPHNHVDDEVFLATVGAIFRSVDGGETWDPVLGRKEISTLDTDLNDSNLSDFSDIVISEEGIFYAVLSQRTRTGDSPDQGVYRSEDGITWNQITPQSWPKNYARTVIATSKMNPDEVFFSVNSTNEMLWKYTYRSGNGSGSGGRWEDLSDNLPAYGGEVGNYDSQNSYNMVLMVHPENEDMVFLGGTNLYRSSDGFSSIANNTWIGGYDTANNITIYLNHYVDQHALAFYPSDPKKMLSSNDGGVFLTEDNTADNMNWRPINNGFVTTQFYTVGLDEFGAKGAIIGGLQDNGTLLANKPTDRSSWNVVLAGDGGYSAISRNSTYYYASFQFGKIYRFTFDKNQTRKTFTRIDPLGSGEEDKLLFVNPFVLAPENQNIMYFAGGDVVWKNTNTSQIPLYKNYQAQVNWQKLTSTELFHITITAINASHNPSGTVFYGTNNSRLFRINEANKAEYSVDEITSASFPRNAYVSCIAIDRRDAKNLVVSFSNYNIISLFSSNDGGASFENISGNLEEHPDGSGSGPSVRWVEIVSKNDETAQYFVGTSTGIYSTDQLIGSYTSWEQEGSETLGNVVVPMIKYFSEDGTIVAATHGNGMYESTLNDVWKIEIEKENNQFAFDDAFPNPFINTTAIPFSIPEDGMVKAGIYNAQGQFIKTILWAEQYHGRNMLSWDGTNEAGARVASGMYICKLAYNEKSIGARIVFTR
jgi:hypothetical protein